MSDPVSTQTATTTPQVAPESQPTQPPQPSATSESVTTPPEMYEIKVNGQVKQLTRDQLIALAQKNDNVEFVTQKLRSKEQQIEQIADKFINNLDEFLERHPNQAKVMEAARKLALKHYEQETRRSQMTPEQLEVERQMQEFQREKQEFMKLKSEQEQMHQQSIQQNYANEVASAFDNTPELPRNKETMSRLLRMKSFYLKQDKDIPFEKLAKHLAKDYTSMFDEYVKQNGFAKAKVQEEPESFEEPVSRNQKGKSFKELKKEWANRSKI